MSLFIKTIHREYLSLIREPKHAVNVFLFFLFVLLIFPLSLPSNMSELVSVAPAIFWMTVLFAALQSAEGFMYEEKHFGLLANWVVEEVSLLPMIYAKLVFAWLGIIIPLLVISPVILQAYHLSLFATGLLVCGVLFGSPAILTLCSFSALFGLGLQQKGVLMALIVFPLLTPLLIFGSGIVYAVDNGQNPLAILAILLAISILALGFIPYAMQAVLRTSVQDS